MSDYRADAHPSKLIIENEDCQHWCLPGVPDFWNALFYNMVCKPYS